jgi:hypothetical protein
MKRKTRSSPAVVLAAILLATSTFAQTPIEPPKNRFSPAQDVELGREAATEVRQQLPLLKDDAVDDFVDRVGERLVAVVPPHLQQPAFAYTFEVVNLKEINAFALPGGPMFLHRGMIEAATTDAEVAGVMAHELSHVILRHGTAQATKGQKFGLGALAGQIAGAIIGGRTGQIIAQGSQFGLGAYFLKYSREYERQADLLGAQLMARAGYEPRQMANMFRTIQREGGGARGPEWMSSHPDPGNRYEAIDREAAMLSVSGSANTSASFQSARRRLAQMSPAPTMEQVARTQQQGRTSGTAGHTMRVEPPSAQFRTHQPANFLRLSVPENWQPVGGGNTVAYAPEGGMARGRSGEVAFTHGVQIGVANGDGAALRSVTEQLVASFARSNPQLRRQSGYSRTNVGGRSGLTTVLSNVSDVTGARESVMLSTVQLGDGNVLYIVGVAPASEARSYANAFSRVRQSVQIADGGIR